MRVKHFAETKLLCRNNDLSQQKEGRYRIQLRGKDFVRAALDACGEGEFVPPPAR